MSSEVKGASAGSSGAWEKAEKQFTKYVLPKSTHSHLSACQHIYALISVYTRAHLLKRLMMELEVIDAGEGGQSDESHLSSLSSCCPKARPPSQKKRHLPILNLLFSFPHISTVKLTLKQQRCQRVL